MFVLANAGPHTGRYAKAHNNAIRAAFEKGRIAPVDFRLASGSTYTQEAMAIYYHPEENDSFAAPIQSGSDTADVLA